MFTANIEHHAFPLFWLTSTFLLRPDYSQSACCHICHVSLSLTVCVHCCCHGDQVDSQRSELERLDQQVGRKRTELQLLQESQERRQAELNSLLRQTESELSAKQREIKVCFVQVYCIELSRVVDRTFYNNNSNRLFMVPRVIRSRNAYKDIRIWSCMHAHIHTHTLMHVHMHAHTCTHTHTHTTFRVTFNCLCATDLILICN